MILHEERGWRGLPDIEGASPLRRLASPILLSPLRSQHKTNLPMRGSYTLPEFVPKNQGFQIWRNAFGAKNGAQAKRRVEAYLTYARKQAKGAFRYAAGVPRRGESSESIAVIRSPHKIPPMRGSYTLPEFVPENQGFQIWRNDFGAKNGAQAKRRIEAY